MTFARLLSLAVVGVLIVPIELLGYGSEAFLGGSNDLPSSAIDAKGVRHTQSAQSSEIPPWMRDGVKLVAPYYPYEDRRLHHTGIGRFRVQLDLNSGKVIQVTIVKPTGFATLDNSAILAFRQSRWKPGKWKEIDVPVRFIMARQPITLPPGAVRLQPH